MAKLLNDAEMVVAVREGKKVRSVPVPGSLGRNVCDVEVRGGDICAVGGGGIRFQADGGPGRWKLIEPETPTTVEYWDAEVKPADDSHPYPWFRRISSETFWWLDEVSRWGDFRGFVWELANGEKVVSALPIFQNPMSKEGFVTFSGDWPLARLVAVRFQGRRPE